MACPLCWGRGCGFCHIFEGEQSRLDTVQAIARRRELEAREFLDGWLNDPKTPKHQRIVPNADTVKLAMDAIEWGKQRLRREEEAAQPAAESPNRFALMEFAER